MATSFSLLVFWLLGPPSFSGSITRTASLGGGISGAAVVGEMSALGDGESGAASQDGISSARGGETPALGAEASRVVSVAGLSSLVAEVSSVRGATFRDPETTTVGDCGLVVVEP